MPVECGTCFDMRVGTMARACPAAPDAGLSNVAAGKREKAEKSPVRGILII